MPLILEKTLIKCTKTSFENGEWKVKEETIQFADEVSFRFAFYQLVSRSNPKSTSKTSTAKEKNAELKNDQVKTDDFESIYLLDNSTVKNRNDDILVDLSATSQRIVNLPPRSMADLLDRTNDFQAVSINQTHTPSLAYWFGLSKFVVLTPTRANSFIDSESRAKVILSSISVAINNTGRLLFQNLFIPKFISKI